MTAKLKEPLAAAVEQVRKSRQRLPVRRNGKVVAAVVSAEDLVTLEEIDAADLRLHRRTLARARKRGEKFTPIEEVAKRLGLSTLSGSDKSRAGGQSGSRRPAGQRR